MKNNLRKIILLLSMVIISAIIISWISPADGDGRNLKVLPKNITSDSLEKLMDDYVEALNVGCAFCHAPKEPSQPKKLNYASDANHLKDVTRTMIRMTDDMNNRYIKPLNKDSMQLVTCNTCHRGEPIPQFK